MKPAPKLTTRKPPAVGTRADVDEWLRKVMPDLNPIVTRLDALIREHVPDLQYAVKYKKAHYGTPSLGWVIELVAYDVSANIVFYAGASFDAPPPLGEGSRYVKVRSLAEAESPEIVAWIKQAATRAGWQ